MKCAKEIVDIASVALEIRRLEEERKKAEELEKERQLRIERQKKRENRVRYFCENVLAPLIKENAKQGNLITKVPLSGDPISKTFINSYFVPLEKGYYSNGNYQGGVYYTEQYTPIGGNSMGREPYEIDTKKTIEYLKQYCYDCEIREGFPYRHYWVGDCKSFELVITPLPECN